MGTDSREGSKEEPCIRWGAHWRPAADPGICVSEVHVLQLSLIRNTVTASVRRRLGPSKSATGATWRMRLNCPRAAAMRSNDCWPSSRLLFSVVVMDVSRRLFFRCNVRLSELVFKRFLEIVGHLVVQLLNAARPTHDVVTYVDLRAVD